MRFGWLRRGSFKVGQRLLHAGGSVWEVDARGGALDSFYLIRCIAGAPGLERQVGISSRVYRGYLHTGQFQAIQELGPVSEEEGAR